MASSFDRPRISGALGASRGMGMAVSSEGPGAEVVAGIEAWVRVESPTHDTAAVDRMMDLVEAEAGAASIASERVPGSQGLADSVILRAGPATGAPGILVLSHLDTVHPV